MTAESFVRICCVALAGFLIIPSGLDYLSRKHSNKYNDRSKMIEEEKYVVTSHSYKLEISNLETDRAIAEDNAARELQARLNKERHDHLQVEVLCV